MAAPLKTFIIYSSKDRELRAELENHLRPLVDQQLLTLWSDKEIAPGEAWDSAIKRNLNKADLFLMLVSVDFYNSGYIREAEFTTAVARVEAGLSLVIPIIARDCDWQSFPVIKDLQVLPPDGVAINDLEHWKTRDKAFATLVRSLRARVEKLHADREAAEAKPEMPKAAPKPVTQSTGPKSAPGEDHAWELTLELGTRAALEKFRARFPQGAYAQEAQARLDALDADDTAWEFTADAGTESALRKYLEKYPGGLHEKEAESRLFFMEQVRLAKERQQEIERRKQQEIETLRKRFDADMVRIPGGRFMMGSEEGAANEKPVHIVTIPAFDLGKYPVTVEQFSHFIAETGYLTDAEKEDGSYIINEKGESVKKAGIHWQHDCEGKLRPASEYDHPIIHVSWNDAKAYCQWLSENTEETYRLPTEAEWEFAAGNGARHTRYSWGDEAPSGKKGGNVADETLKKRFPSWTAFQGYTDGFVFTAPVGSFEPNLFGLYDMSGNVWEWCEDWFHDSYKGAPTDGSAWLLPAGSYSVLRGGSWGSGPRIRICRVAFRLVQAPVFRDYGIGFRVARTVSL